MSKNKQKNQYGTFLAGKMGYKKNVRLLVTAIVAVIFVLGTVYIIVDNKKHSKTQAATAFVPSEIPGWWYQQYFISSVCDKDICKPEADPDKDGLTNVQEYFYHTDPLSAYTVQDTLNDGALVAAGFDPSQTGRKTFDQVAAPENLLGESLVFSQDIKKMVADDLDISKVNLPLVKDDELQIINDSNDEVYKTYASKLQSTINKYFRSEDIASIKEIFKSGSDVELEVIKTKSEALASELRTIPVPSRLLMFHKYNIVMFQLLSEIIPAPANLSDPESDLWYEKVQAFLAVQQKLSFEEQSLNR